MTLKKELSGIVSNGYHSVNSRWCPKSPGLTSDKTLLLSDQSLLKGEDRKKNTTHKNGSSNLLVDKTKSVVKSKSNSCNTFDFDRFMAIKKRIRRRQYEF